MFSQNLKKTKVKFHFQPGVITFFCFSRNFFPRPGQLFIFTLLTFRHRRKFLTFLAHFQSTHFFASPLAQQKFVLFHNTHSLFRRRRKSSLALKHDIVKTHRSWKSQREYCYPRNCYRGGCLGRAKNLTAYRHPSISLARGTSGRRPDEANVVCVWPGNGKSQGHGPSTEDSYRELDRASHTPSSISQSQ